MLAKIWGGIMVDETPIFFQVGHLSDQLGKFSQTMKYSEKRKRGREI